ncbi:hypothetical protein [Micavibrio aeruginosavorus]|uniref:AMIN domain-containing protein n=1 Tax=Micavibrio aeruginosavorus (strain ARL-13) TaxID=856793 RepID=G2KQ76_MICAA|nr:hypothetical protein [Micavibrio aeruginosavorus]AEP08618.1 hypothetical protein MICA_272 [Micavibrio aeruginosavorus ARL-13]
MSMSFFRAPRPTLNRLFCSTALMVCALTLSACGGSDAEDVGVVQTTTQICPMAMAETPPAMQPARGMNVSPEALFVEDIQDPVARIKRAEAAIIDLRRDMNALQAPTMHSVAAPLTAQDQAPMAAPVMVASTAAPQSLFPVVEAPAPVTTTAPATTAPAPAPAAPAPVMAPVMDEPAVKAAAPVKTKVTAPSGPVISALRIGEHAGKTRLVLDAGSPVKFTTDLDNSEDLLLVELPGMKWTAAKSGTSSSPAIKSWSTQAMDNGTDGTRLVLVLRQDVAVTDKSLIAPDANAAHYRAVIDLKHQGTIKRPPPAPKAAPEPTPEPVKTEEPKVEAPAAAATPAPTAQSQSITEPVKTEPATAAAPAPATTTATATTPTPDSTAPAASVPPPSMMSAPKTTATTPDGHGHDTVQDGELLSGGQ